MRRQVPQSFFMYLSVVYLGAKHDLSVDLDIVIEQPLEFIKDVCPLFINSEQVRSGFQVGGMN